MATGYSDDHHYGTVVVICGGTIARSPREFELSLTSTTSFRPGSDPVKLLL